MPIPQGLRIIAGFSIAIFTCGGLFGAESGPSNEPTLVTKASDATLRDCTASTSDRVWMVGDRGLIMASDNGGRTWSQQESFTEANLHGVAFENDKLGWAVGGSVQAYSHRSVGVVLVTRDGGQNWTPIHAPELPRLKGVQAMGNGHLIVWGDWSPALQTGLIESFDSGGTWSPKTLPASHIETCAWFDAHHGIVVDRLSRVFYFSAQEPPRSLAIAGDPTKPILAAAVNEAGWWLAGDGGQVFWSADGRKWSQRSLPGSSSDHQLVSIQGMALDGEHAWLLGSPGNVIWHSENRGSSWDNQSTSNALPMHCICAATSQCLFAGGSLARIEGTRNQGRGWWPIHSAGSRIALLNFATTTENIAWDSLGYMANETRHQAAAIVVHSQHLHEQAGAICDSQNRIEGLANPLGLSFIDICPKFPVGDLPQGRRSSDLRFYNVNRDRSSQIVRQVAMWIRVARPDVILCDEPRSSDPLVVASVESIKTARRLAAENTYQSFSPQAGFADEPWNCKLIIARNASSNRSSLSMSKHRADLNYAPTTVLKSSGQLLADILAPVIPTIESLPAIGSHRFQAIDSALYANYEAVYGSMARSSKDYLLADMVSSVQTKRPALRSRQSNFQKIIAGSHHTNLLEKLAEMDGPDIAIDRRWQTALKSFLRSTPSEHHADSLWQLAQGYRHSGYWNRWRVCLETLMAEAPRSGAAELSCLQALMFYGSDEVNLYRLKSADPQEIAVETPDSKFQTSFISSPFSQDVQKSGHPTKAVATVRPSEDEFRRIRSTLPVRFPTLQWDPRFLTVDASFYRQNDGKESSEIRPKSIPRLVSCHGLFGWPTIGMQEDYLQHISHGIHQANIESLSNSSLSLYPIRKTHLRPLLDGCLEDPLWQSISTMSLEDVLHEVQPAVGQIRMAHDGEFIYVSAFCPRIGSGKLLLGEASDATAEKLTIRLDTDRDYLTWFELQVDANGQVAERCVDMEDWEPEWYFKTERDEHGWRFEAAIPIAQLQSASIESNPTWSVAIQRDIPNLGVQMNRADYADRLQSTSATLIHFCR
ncbi:MAG: YCF48-related protein [Pirellulaceae bacterium]|nr:YCF48-related protein [Pirellulaceae bacterium]